MGGGRTMPGALLFLAAATWLCPGNRKVYKIGYAHFPPLLVNSGNAPGGFAAGVVAEAARRKGIKLHWVPLEGAPDVALQNGVIDLYPLMADTPERRRRLHLTQPWWESTLMLIVDQRSGLRSAEQMDQKKIAFVGQSISANLVRQLFPKAQYVPKTPYEDVLRAACSGEADAAFLAIGLYMDLLQQRVHGCEDVSLAPIPVPEAIITYSIAAGKGAEGAADAIASVISTLTYDGTMSKLGARTGVLVSNQAQLIRSLTAARRIRNFWIVVAGLLGSLAVIIGWQNRRVRQARELADKARMAEAEFLAHMSHEIRTPMNGVLGMLGLALETNPDAELQEYLETANHSALALMSVLNDILDFSKIDAGKLELEQVSFSVAEVIEQTVKTLSPESRRKGLSVAFEIALDVPSICVGDPNRLRQVLLNLLGNAIKFTERGSVLVKAHAGRLGETDAALQMGGAGHRYRHSAGKAGIHLPGVFAGDQSTTRDRRHGTGPGRSRHGSWL